MASSSREDLGFWEVALFPVGAGVIFDQGHGQEMIEQGRRQKKSRRRAIFWGVRVEMRTT